MLPADALVAEAARRGLRPLPSPKDMPIDTVVVLMMENRSFDHYFGWFPERRRQERGPVLPRRPRPPGRHPPPERDFQGCAFRDPDHSWDGGRFQYDHGKMDGFVKGNASGTGSDAYAAGYYLRRDLPFIPYAARRLHAL